MTENLRVAVTGGSGSIGAAIVAELRVRRHQVVVLDLNVSSANGECYPLDVTQIASVNEAFDAVGSIDVLVLAHGITALGAAMNVPTDAVERVIDVNLTGTIRCVARALPTLIERRGRIAVLSSVAGFAPLVHRTAYAASKHGLHGFFDSLRAETAETGLSITMVAPSFVATGIEDRAAFRAHGRDGSWSTTGSVTKAEPLAEMIVDAVLERKRLLLPSRTSKLAYIVSRLAPGGYERLMRKRISND